MNSPVKIPVALFFDYTCPFCYIASVRLERLAERYPLLIRWRFVEIHPNTPAAGMPLEKLGYPPAQWAQMNAALDAMAAEEGIPMAKREFSANTRRALLLAQAAHDLRPERFMDLHRAIFRAYFGEGRNIGDPEVMTAIAREAGVDDLLEAAWGGPAFYQRLLTHVEAAQRLHLSGVPALKVGPRVFTGAVSVQTLELALQQAANSPESP